MALIALVFVFTACNDGAEVVEQKVYIPTVKTITVAPGVSSEIQTTGEVQAQRSATLTSEVRADVAKVLVKNGESVVAGQALIILDSASVKTSVSTARNAYTNASSGVTQTGFSVEKNIEAARIALSTAEINLANSIAQNIAARRQAEEIFNTAKLNASLSSSSAQTALDNAVRSAAPTARNAVAECDEIMGVSEIYRYSNDAFEDLLGAFKNTTKASAEIAISVALASLGAEPTDYAAAQNLLKTAEAATTATLGVLNNSTTGSTLTQADLSNYIAGITTQLAAVRNALSALDSAKRALESAAQNSNGESQTVISARAAYNSTIAQINSSEEAARRAVESAKVALSSAERGAALNRVSAKTSLDAALGGLQQAQITADKLTIRAPFSGKVTGVEVKAGEEVNIGGNLVSVEDPNGLKIVAYLSAEEVRKIRVGDEVKIAAQSKDKITSISPSADSLTKKYRVEINHKNPFIHPGEFIKLRFQVGENSNNDSRIFLPVTAINVFSSGNFVWLVEDAKIVKRLVTLGEFEGEFVEIVSGLDLGEEVVTEGGRIFEEKDEGKAVTIAS